MCDNATLERAAIRRVARIRKKLWKFPNLDYVVRRAVFAPPANLCVNWRHGFHNYSFFGLAYEGILATSFVVFVRYFVVFFCPTAHMFSSTFFFTRSHALSHLHGFLVSVGVGGPIGIRYQSAMRNIGIGTMHILIVLSHTMYFLGCCPPPPPPRLLLSSGARRAGGLGAFLSVLSAAQSAQIVFFLRLHARSNRFF